MPGIVQEQDGPFVDDDRAYRSRATKANSPTNQNHGIVHSRVPGRVYQTSEGESYHVPYPFQTRTTAYGLNEPQWSVGPPPIINNLSPYARIPLPPVVGIHALLMFNEASAIDWSVDQHPQYAMPAPGRSMVDPYHWKSLPAINPANGQTLLRIRVKPFREHITVYSKDNKFITIGDVLQAVYTGVRQRTTEAFCQSLGLDPRFIQGHEISSYARIATQSTGPPAGDDDVSANVRGHMDFRTRWLGLTPSREEQDVWVLHTRAIDR